VLGLHTLRKLGTSCFTIPALVLLRCDVPAQEESGELPPLSSTFERHYRALPNGWRLNCGAELEWSQITFYYTACKTFSAFMGDGAVSFKRAIMDLVSAEEHLCGAEWCECGTATFAYAAVQKGFHSVRGE
jgi:hypothetical protein